MTQLHERFNALWQLREVEPLLLIPYILDFLFGTAMVAPSVLLLYQAG